MKDTLYLPACANEFVAKKKAKMLKMSDFFMRNYKLQRY